MSNAIQKIQAAAPTWEVDDATVVWIHLLDDGANLRLCISTTAHVSGFVMSGAACALQ
jgi:hypothetical protein